MYFEVTYFDANINRMALLRLNFELPASGGVVTKADVSVVKLYLYDTNSDAAVIVGEVLLVFMVAVHWARLAYSASHARKMQAASMSLQMVFLYYFFVASH